MKESDLYDPVKEWLENRGYKVYSEVEPKGASGRADVVGINDADTLVVELKLSLSLELLNQAVNWSQGKYANYIYIAVPWIKKNKSQPYLNNWLVGYICRQFHIGIIFVQQNWDGRLFVSDKPYEAAKFSRTNKTNNFKTVIEKFQNEYDNSDLKGGQKGGGYITQYRVTVDRVKEFLDSAKNKKRFSLYWYEDGKMIDLRDRAVDGWVDLKTILNHLRLIMHLLKLRYPKHYESLRMIGASLK